MAESYIRLLEIFFSNKFFVIIYLTKLAQIIHSVEILDAICISDMVSCFIFCDRKIRCHIYLLNILKGNGYVSISIIYDSITSIYLYEKKTIESKGY